MIISTDYEPLTIRTVVELINRYPDSAVAEDIAELLITVSGDLVYEVTETCRRCGEEYPVAKVISRCPRCRTFHLSCGACGQDVMYGDTMCSRCEWGNMHPFLDRTWTAEMFKNTLSIYGYRKNDNEYEQEFAVLKNRVEELTELIEHSCSPEEEFPEAEDDRALVEFGTDRII